MGNFADIARLFALNLPALAAAWLLSGAILRRRRGPDRVLAAAVVFAALATVSLLLLSSAGAIRFSTAFGAQLAALAAAIVVARYLGGKAMSGDPDSGSANSRDIETPRRDITADAAGVAIKIIAATLFVMMCSFALTMPPPPTDAFLDHLVFPAEWLRAGRVTLVQTLSPEQATTYYPANGELMYLWLMLPLNDDLLCGLMESASLLAAALAASAIGVRAGMTPKWATTAAAAAVAVPVTLAQALQFGIDLYFAAFFLTAVAFLMPRPGGKRETGDILVAGLAAGLAIGSKYLGAAMFALLLPLLLKGARGEPRSRVAARAALFIFAAAATGAFWYVRNLAATGSPFYPMGFDIFGVGIFEGAFPRAAMYRSYLHISVSDLAALGKIISVRVFGPWLIGGLGAALAVSALRASSGAAARAICAAFAASVCLFVAAALNPGLFPTAVAAALPVVVASLFMALVLSVVAGSASGVSPRVSMFHAAFALAFAPAVFLMFWHVNPYNIENNARFLVPGIFIAVVGVGAALSRGNWERGWWLVVPGMLIGNREAAARFWMFARDAAVGGGGAPEWVSSAAPALALFVVAAALGMAAFASLVRGRARRALVPAVLAAVALAAAVPLKSEHMQNHRYRWYGGHYLSAGWQALAAIEQPLTVAYAGNCSPYGLYGHRLKNRVIYANVDGRAGAVFHDYELERRAEADYVPPVESVWLNHIFRGEPDFDAWLSLLHKEDVDVLFLTREMYQGRVETPVELVWALENPDLFMPYFVYRDTYIFSSK